MQISGITLANWLTHRHFKADFAPMTIVAGPNGAGKSSIRDGISFAILASLCRVDAKGDRPKLISEGAEKGSVSLRCGKATIGRDIATGKLTTREGFPLGEEAVKDAMGTLLDPASFARIDPDDRRGLMLKVIRTDLSAGGIKKALADRGHAAAMLKDLPDDETIQQWETKAGRTASEMRGAWRAATGETYGSKKAEGWTAPQPEGAVTEEAVAAAKTELEVARTELGDLQRELGALDSAAASLAGREGKLTALRAKAGGMVKAAAASNARKADMAAARAAEDKALGVFEDLKRRLPSSHLTCPHCSGAISVVDRGEQVIAFTPPTNAASVADLENSRAALSRAKAAVVSATESAQRAAQEYTDAQAASTALIDMGDETPAAIDLTQRDEVQAALTEAQGRVHDLQQKLEMLQQGAQEARRADQATAAATNAHKAVEAWVAIANDLAPAGIPGQLLAKGLGDFNATLQWIASETGWRQVAIGEDISIRADGRPYGLLCESEQWRADACVAVAIAMHAELRFVILDRLDVLEPEHRRTAMKWLYGLIKTEELESAILLGTMVRRPEVPADVGVVWLGTDEGEQEAA